MPRLSKIFKLGVGQGGLDFVDTMTERDIPVFIEPYALGLRSDPWSSLCTDHIVSFFDATIGAIRAGHEADARALLAHFGEPNETGLGYGKKRNAGRGVTGEKANRLLGALKRSSAIRTGVLTDLGEADLFVEGISVDGISDLATSILRGPLIDFTQQQCSNLSIPTSNVAAGFVWDPALQKWTEKYAQLPIARGSPQILVPKHIVRRRMLLNSQEYYSKHVIEFIRSQEYAADSGLSRLLRAPRRLPTKKEIKEKNPFSKEFLARFSLQHPHVLEKYKEFYASLPSATGIVSDEELSDGFREDLFAKALKEELANIAPGTANADSYHKLMLAICELLFFPSLAMPECEYKLHAGRKRVDIMYSNIADVGFFHRMMSYPQTKSVVVPIECKNYSEDPKNPQLDQLAGYFGEMRGWFGILLYRSSADDDRILERCRDTAKDGRGVILPLSDFHITQLLDFVEGKRRSKVEEWLQRRFNSIVAK